MASKSKAKELLKKAVEHAKVSEFDEAMELVDESLEVMETPEGFTNKGHIYRKLKDWKNAADNYARAIAINADSEKAIAGLEAMKNKLPEEDWPSEGGEEPAPKPEKKKKKKDKARPDRHKAKKAPKPAPALPVKVKKRRPEPVPEEEPEAPPAPVKKKRPKPKPVPEKAPEEPPEEAPAPVRKKKAQRRPAEVPEEEPAGPEPERPRKKKRAPKGKVPAPVKGMPVRKGKLKGRVRKPKAEMAAVEVVEVVEKTPEPQAEAEDALQDIKDVVKDDHLKAIMQLSPDILMDFDPDIHRKLEIFHHIEALLDNFEEAEDAVKKELATREENVLHKEREQDLYDKELELRKKQVDQRVEESDRRFMEAEKHLKGIEDKGRSVKEMDKSLLSKSKTLEDKLEELKITTEAVRKRQSALEKKEAELNIVEKKLRKEFASRSANVKEKELDTLLSARQIASQEIAKEREEVDAKYKNQIARLTAELRKEREVAKAQSVSVEKAKGALSKSKQDREELMSTLTKREAESMELKEKLETLQQYLVENEKLLRARVGRAAADREKAPERVKELEEKETEITERVKKLETAVEDKAEAPSEEDDIGDVDLGDLDDMDLDVDDLDLETEKTDVERSSDEPAAKEPAREDVGDVDLDDMDLDLDDMDLDLGDLDLDLDLDAAPSADVKPKDDELLAELE